MAFEGFNFPRLREGDNFETIFGKAGKVLDRLDEIKKGDGEMQRKVATYNKAVTQASTDSNQGIEDVGQNAWGLFKEVMAQLTPNIMALHDVARADVGVGPDEDEAADEGEAADEAPPAE